MVFCFSLSVWAHLLWGGRLVPLLLHPHLVLWCHLIPVPRELLPQPQGSRQAPLLSPKSFGNVAVSSFLQGTESLWGLRDAPQEPAPQGPLCPAASQVLRITLGGG